MKRFKTLAAFGLAVSIAFGGIPLEVKAADGVAFPVYTEAGEITATNTDVNITIIPVPSPQPISGDATQVYNGHTYTVYDESMTWHEAKARCESLGGHLAVITSREEQAFIFQLISNGRKNIYWLGGTDEQTEGAWTWVTGEAWGYTNWAKGEPSGGSESYINVNRLDDPNNSENKAGTWNDLHVNGDDFGLYIRSELGFICEYDDVVITEGEKQDEDTSAVHRYSFDNREYEVIERSMTWHDAKEYCEKMGGHLVTITSSEEQDFVSRIISNGGCNIYWIGGTDENLDGQWTWVTGEKWSYFNWGSNEPNGGYNEGYININRIDEPGNTLNKAGRWNDLRNLADSSGFFMLSSSGFVCEYDGFSTELYQDVSSKHFVWTKDMDWTTNYITKKKLERWLDWLDTAYEQYAVLTGFVPCDGKKIPINVSPDTVGVLWWRGDHIGINENAAVGMLKSINEYEICDFGSLHEIGHAFDEGGYWNFHGEFFANFKMLYVLEKMNMGVGVEGVEDYAADLMIKTQDKSQREFDKGEQSFSSYMKRDADGFMRYFVPVIKKIGWEPVKATFRSYRDNSYTPSKTFAGNQEAIKFWEFADRLSYFSGVDVTSMLEKQDSGILTRIYSL